MCCAHDRDVYYLEIAMDHSLFVHVVDGLQDLPDEVGSVLLRVRAFLDDPIEQFTTGHPDRAHKHTKYTLRNMADVMVVYIDAHTQIYIYIKLMYKI